MHQPEEPSNHPFDESYFKTGTYANVSFKTYSQYWWSNRFYAILAKKHGPQRGRVLEVGCGMGHLLAHFIPKYEVYGVDINSWALAEAKRMIPSANFVIASAEDLNVFPNQTFSIVISKHVVEHLPNPGAAVAEMSRLLIPGGLLLLSTPNLLSLMRNVKKEKWIGYRDRTHISLHPPDYWIGLLKDNNLKPRRIFSDGFWDAPYIRFLPTRLQKFLFGAPGGLQAIFGWSILPLVLGESLIVIACKNHG